MSQAVDDPVRVVMCADEIYAMPLAVAVRSLLDNATTPLEVMVLGRSLTAHTVRRLRRSWPDDAAVTFIDVDEQLLEGLSPLGYVTTTMYLRIFIPELVPSSWRRVIYLDADTVVCSDLRELWNHDLQGRPIAATDGPLFARWWAPRRPASYGDSETPVFNSGVLLMDLDLWRAEDLPAVIMAIAHDLPEELQSDITALNLALGDRWSWLDPSWQVTTDMYFRAQRHLYSDAVANMRIRHFSPFKPWQEKYRNSPDADLFRRYRDLTDWKV